MILTLYDYWRSSAAFRVRIALHLKGVAFSRRLVDLRQGAQQEADYRARNPQGLVPALDVGGAVLTQSLAIIEWLEETNPTPPLLPAAAGGRAMVRAMAGLIACDIHPLNNLRVLNTLRHDLSAGDAEVKAWIAKWIGEGFTALEELTAQHGGAFLYGDTPTLADCCLIPQIYNAQRFEVDLSSYPRLTAINAHAQTLPAFAAAHPSAQPEAE